MQKEFEDKISNFANGDMDDVVGLFEISEWIAKHFNIEDNASLIEMTIKFVNSALDRGFKAGYSPYDQEGFAVWKNQDKAYVDNQIRKEWQAYGEVRPSLNTPIWFGLPAYEYPTR